MTAFVALGNAVSHGPPSALDVAAHAAFYGHAVPLAVVLTQSGRFPAYVTLCAVALVFGVVRRAWLVRAAVSIAVLIGAEAISDLFKDHFARLRPPHQLVFFEPSYAYASGHAALSLTFYGGWALYAWHSDLPNTVRVAIAAAAAVAAIAAVSWSRLALGAHWATDVVGGLLLGGVFVVVQSVVTRRYEAEAPANPFSR